MKKLILSLFLILSVSAYADENTRMISLEGMLGPDNIHFRLDLEEDKYEGFIAGETTYYRKNGIVSTIKVWGRGMDNKEGENTFHTIVVNEFNGTKICGMFVIILNSDMTVREGCWTLNGKVLDMSEIENIESSENSKFLKKVDILSASGVYKFSADSDNPTMPEYGGTLQLYVEGKNIAYSACQVTPNIAETQGKMSEFWGNQFYFYAGDIYYLTYVYEGAAFIVRNRWTDKGEQNEMFGNAADIVGVYIATDEKPEGEVLKMFDEEKEFALQHLPCTVFELNDVWMEAVGGETTFPDEIITKDIDGDGIQEIIARYIPNRTDLYEVGGKRSAIFTFKDGYLINIAKSEGDLEELSIADGYVIKSVSNKSGSRTSDYFYRLSSSTVEETAKMTKAEIDSYTINERTVSEKEFKKSVKCKNRIQTDNMDGWLAVPGNQYRNEHAARG